MTVSAGTHLGSYEVVAPIGAGGMGEVYQAHDTKLGRDVAIKVLPGAFAHDPERLSRFQREAKMLAALNHPNIATIYGLEQSSGTSLLVMELVPGETLAERIKRDGAVPVEEALAIAKQIAETLEAAHEKSIIHRDLKPANVKVTPEGKVKVLDFGLAKAFAGDSTSTDPSESPTLSMAATTQGVILGTAAYMSPEQAEGKAVDKRSDMWAFGCVLYELLTGKAAFQGEGVHDILASVVRAEPDLSLLPDATPQMVRTLLRRCLQKDKTSRLRDAGDARIEIQEALAAPLAAGTRAAATPRPTFHRWALLSGFACLGVAVIVVLAVWKLKPTPQKPVTRTLITLPPGDQLAALDNLAIAISPDGTQLAYVGIRGGTRQIFLRALNSLEAKPLAGTEGAGTPFFSPDGQWIGFFAAGSMKKIPVSGGAASTLGSFMNSIGASWSSGGTIAFTPNGGSPIQQVSDAGGALEPLTRLDKGETGHISPELLPGSKAVLFSTTGANPQVAVQSLSSGERRNLVPGGSSPRYASSGHLIYAQGGNLMAAPFDPQRLQLTGTAVPIVEGVLQLIRATQYSISDTGALVYVPGGVQAAAEHLVWVRRNGSEQTLAATQHIYTYPRLSPDGRRLAVTIAEEDAQIWLYDLARDTLTRLTFGGNINQVPTWTPDGTRIAFNSTTKETPQQNLFWQLADGSGGLERLTTSKYNHGARSFSPDGQLLAYSEINPTTGFDIWMLRLSDRTAEPFLRTTFNEAAPAFSPDGHWLAYISDESGRYEVYVQPYPGPGGKNQISTEGGTEPVWNRNGRELFYRSGEKMMAVDITTQPSFSAGRPKMLFQGPYLPTFTTVPFYDVSPDGGRFLMISPGEPTTPHTQIVVVQNWFEELKQKVPSGRK